MRQLCNKEKEVSGNRAGRLGEAMQLTEVGKPLIKFSHCKKSIYSFSVPQCCPLCHQDLGSWRLEEAPVSISSPFTNGHQEKCSFLLRPTQGTFLSCSEGLPSAPFTDEETEQREKVTGPKLQDGALTKRRPRAPSSLSEVPTPPARHLGGETPLVSFRDYDGRADLHVGIASTAGVVYNYTANGVRRDKAGWEQSVSVPLLPPGMFGLIDQWDKYLEDFSNTGVWLPHRYEEDQNNCYSYTLTFINCILAMESWEQLDKNEFTEKFVVPRTRQASRYITLYRAVEERGFCVTPGPDPEAAALQASAPC